MNMVYIAFIFVGFISYFLLLVALLRRRKNRTARPRRGKANVQFFEAKEIWNEEKRKSA